MSEHALDYPSQDDPEEPCKKPSPLQVRGEAVRNEGNFGDILDRQTLRRKRGGSLTMFYSLQGRCNICLPKNPPILESLNFFNAELSVLNRPVKH